MSSNKKMTQLKKYSTTKFRNASQTPMQATVSDQSTDSFAALNKRLDKLTKKQKATSSRTNTTTQVASVEPLPEKRLTKRTQTMKMLSVDTGIRSILRKEAATESMKQSSIDRQAFRSSIRVKKQDKKVKLPKIAESMRDSQSQFNKQAPPSPTRLIKESLRIHGALEHQTGANQRCAYEEFVMSNFRHNLRAAAAAGDYVDYTSPIVSPGLENIKERTQRHSDDHDIDQIYATDVSALKKLRLGELQQKSVGISSDLASQFSPNAMMVSQYNTRKPLIKPTNSEARNLKKLFRRQRKRGEDGQEIGQSPGEVSNFALEMYNTSTIEDTRVDQLKSQVKKRVQEFERRSPFRGGIHDLQQRLPFLSGKNNPGAAGPRNRQNQLNTSYDFLARQGRKGDNLDVEGLSPSTVRANVHGKSVLESSATSFQSKGLKLKKLGSIHSKQEDLVSEMVHPFTSHEDGVKAVTPNSPAQERMLNTFQGANSPFEINPKDNQLQSDGDGLHSGDHQTLTDENNPIEEVPPEEEVPEFASPPDIMSPDQVVQEAEEALLAPDASQPNLTETNQLVGDQSLVNLPAISQCEIGRPEEANQGEQSMDMTITSDPNKIFTHSEQSPSQARIQPLLHIDRIESQAEIAVPEADGSAEEGDASPDTTRILNPEGTHPPNSESESLKSPYPEAQATIENDALQSDERQPFPTDRTFENVNVSMEQSLPSTVTIHPTLAGQSTIQNDQEFVTQLGSGQSPENEYPTDLEQIKMEDQNFKMLSRQSKQGTMPEVAQTHRHEKMGTLFDPSKSVEITLTSYNGAGTERTTRINDFGDTPDQSQTANDTTEAQNFPTMQKMNPKGKTQLRLNLYERGQVSKSINFTTHPAQIWHNRKSPKSSRSKTQANTEFIRKQQEKIARRYLSKQPTILDRNSEQFGQLFPRPLDLKGLPNLVATSTISPTNMPMLPTPLNAPSPRRSPGGEVMKSVRELHFPMTTKGVKCRSKLSQALLTEESSIAMPMFMLGSSKDIVAIINRVKQQQHLRNKQRSPVRSKGQQSPSILDQQSPVFCPSVMDLQAIDTELKKKRKIRVHHKDSSVPISSTILMNDPSYNSILFNEKLQGTSELTGQVSQKVIRPFNLRINLSQSSIPDPFLKGIDMEKSDVTGSCNVVSVPQHQGNETKSPRGSDAKSTPRNKAKSPFRFSKMHSSMKELDRELKGEQAHSKGFNSDVHSGTDLSAMEKTVPMRAHNSQMTVEEDDWARATFLETQKTKLVDKESAAFNQSGGTIMVQGSKDGGNGSVLGSKLSNTMPRYVPTYKMPQL